MENISIHHFIEEFIQEKDFIKYVKDIFLIFILMIKNIGDLINSRRCASFGLRPPSRYSPSNLLPFEQSISYNRDQLVRLFLFLEQLFHMQQKLC